MVAKGAAELESSSQQSSERARWLAELAAAVAEAQQLALTLGESGALRRQASEFHAQLEAIRIELEMLQRGRAAGVIRQEDPNWTNLLSWTTSSNKQTGYTP